MPAALLALLILALVLAAAAPGLVAPAAAEAAIAAPATTTTVAPSPAKLPVFHLPYPAGTAFMVSQGNGGLFTHDPGKTNYVVLEHPDGLHSLYFHLAYQGVVVKLGQQVAAGQIIAMSGNTGHSTGPHLHFEVQGNNRPHGAMSIPVTFAEAGVPRTGDIPLTASVLTPRPPAPRAAAAVPFGTPAL